MIILAAFGLSLIVGGFLVWGILAAGFLVLISSVSKKPKAGKDFDERGMY